jgi:dTDP-glucose 4,6-dehydratase
MKTLLVTGGAGFIGANFVLQAVAEGLRVVNLDKLTYAGNPDTLAALAGNERHVFVHGDIGDRALVSRLLAEHRPDAIVNFAAESHVDRSIDGPAEFVQTNVVGTLGLLECSRDFWRGLEGAARDAFRFLHVSTDEVYGSLGAEGKFTEQTPYAPNSPYSASKAASDHLVRAFHHTYGLPVLTTNCSNNYGPYQFPEKLIPLMIIKALNDQPLPVYGDGLNVRDWIHVEDHCAALVAALFKGKAGEVYNIGGDGEMVNLEVVKLILDRLGKTPSLISFVTDRLGHDRRYAIDSTFAKRELDWHPLHTPREGISATIDWYLNNRSWWETLLHRTERFD